MKVKWLRDINVSNGKSTYDKKTNKIPDKNVNTILILVDVFLNKSSNKPPKKHGIALIPRIIHKPNISLSMSKIPDKNTKANAIPPILGVLVVWNFWTPFVSSDVIFSWRPIVETIIIEKIKDNDDNIIAI